MKLFKTHCPNNATSTISYSPKYYTSIGEIDDATILSVTKSVISLVEKDSGINQEDKRFANTLIDYSIDIPQNRQQINQEAYFTLSPEEIIYK